ncbi:MAG: DNA-directed RNA polymerase subunit B [Candidatus Micrarchaeota archaeon]
MAKRARKVAIYLNGRFVGYHPDGRSLAQRLRERRRTNELNYQINIYYSGRMGELHITTDKGRVRRPYLVVENGKSRLTPEVLNRLKNNELTWQHLIRMGIIEYLDALEEENALVAATPAELTEKHTHLEVDPANIFGIVASVLPYAEHNSSPRITMACAMTKQSLGIYATNFNSRYDTRAYVMYYPQEPLTRTNVYKALNLREKAAGQNCVVALASFHGYNMADAIIVNKAAIDRGMLRTVMFRTYEAEERTYPGGQKDTIELPTPEVGGYRGEIAYSHLDEDGIVIPESEVTSKNVLVGKTSPPRFLEEISVFGAVEEKKRESSLALKSGEEGKVDSVLITEGPSGNRMVKVRIRAVKTPEVGDKIASRHGQKGVIGLLVPQQDMPFTEDGITPDLIVNPHAIPSRMTAGHLLEMLGGKAGSMGGVFMNGSAFSGNTEKDFVGLLKEAGFDEHGEEVLYDGTTGKQIHVKLFIGVVYYQRLHHLVSNKMHVRSRGPVQLLTNQPTEGRAREGGLRFGEMERDCLLGYGASMLIKERLLEESDKTNQLVCADCGSTGTHDYARNKDLCPVCGGANVQSVEISYAFKLLLDEIKSLYIFPRLLLRKKG